MRDLSKAASYYASSGCAKPKWVRHDHLDHSEILVFRPLKSREILRCFKAASIAAAMNSKEQNSQINTNRYIFNRRIQAPSTRHVPRHIFQLPQHRLLEHLRQLYRDRDEDVAIREMPTCAEAAGSAGRNQ
jgi:hypothetical protein